MSRRQLGRLSLRLLQWLAAAMGAALAWRYLGWRVPGAEVVVFPPRSPGDPPVRVEGGAVLLERAGQVSALSSRCTHLGCTVLPAGDGARLVCPCHGSQYDLDGRVLHGPAHEALARLPVQVMDDGSVQVRGG